MSFVRPDVSQNSVLGGGKNLLAHSDSLASRARTLTDDGDEVLGHDEVVMVEGVDGRALALALAAPPLPMDRVEAVDEAAARCADGHPRVVLAAGVRGRGSGPAGGGGFGDG